MCRQALMPIELFDKLTQEEFRDFGLFLESQGGGAGNGVGFISIDGQAKGLKGVSVSWDDIYNWLSESRDEVKDFFVIHTRIPSVGQKMDSLCHPFILNPTKRFPSEWSGGSLETVEDFDLYEMYSRHEPTVLTFNGTWTKWKEFYLILAAQGYPLPVYESPRVSDALVMAQAVFGMGVKILPAISSGAAIILQPEYQSLVVNRSTILKYCEWKGIPMYSSSIPNLEEMTNIKNVETGVHDLTPNFILSDKEFGPYTPYNHTNVTWRSKTAWTSGKCVLCNKQGAHKLIGKAHVCWSCRQKNDFDEQVFLSTHPEYQEGTSCETLEEYEERKEESCNIVPFVPVSQDKTTHGTNTTPVTGAFNFVNSPFLEEVAFQPSEGKLPVDSRFPNLYKTVLGELVWYKNDGMAYLLGDKDSLETDVIVNLLNRDVFSTLYHKPEWGAIWAELVYGSFVIWDVLGTSDNIEGDVEIYYYKTDEGDKKIISTLKTDWKVFANGANVAVFDAWGIVYDYASLIKWLEERLKSENSTYLGIDVLYEGPRLASPEDEYILMYLALGNDDRLGPCEICERREGIYEVNDTILCHACARFFNVEQTERYAG